MVELADKSVLSVLIITNITDYSYLYMKPTEMHWLVQPDPVLTLVTCSLSADWQLTANQTYTHTNRRSFQDLPPHRLCHCIELDNTHHHHPASNCCSSALCWMWPSTWSDVSEISDTFSIGLRYLLKNVLALCCQMMVCCCMTSVCHAFDPTAGSTPKIKYISHHYRCTVFVHITLLYQCIYVFSQ